jgi:hypothetical protein
LGGRGRKIENSKPARVKLATPYLKNKIQARCRWLIPTQEAEIKRIEV